MTRKAQRADGRYQIQIDLGIGPDGKRIRKYFYGKTQREAYLKREEWMDRQKQAAAPAADRSFRDWAKYWVETYCSGMALSTQRVYATTARKLTGWFGDRRLADITQGDLQQFLNALAGKSCSTIRHAMTTIEGMFRAAVVNRILTASPAEGIRAPKAAPAGGHRALAKEERTLIMEHCREYPAGMWSALMMLTGMRRGEALGLTWEHVDLQRREIHVVQSADKDGNISTPKTNSGIRTVPIMQQLYDLLIAVPVKDRAGYVLRTPRTSGIRPVMAHSAAYQMTLFQQAIGISFTPHDLRYTYATILYDAGVDLKTAQYLMGHKNVQVTLQIYTQLSEATRAASVSRLQEYLTANLTAISTQKG